MSRPRKAPPWHGGRAASPKGRPALNKPAKDPQIVRVKMDANLWHRWLAEHNERMANPAVRLAEKDSP